MSHFNSWDLVIFCIPAWFCVLWIKSALNNRCISHNLFNTKTPLCSSHKQSISGAFILIRATLPMQDGLKVQEDLRFLLSTAVLSLLFPRSHELPWRHSDLSTRHHLSSRSCKQKGASRRVNVRMTSVHALMHMQITEFYPPTPTNSLFLHATVIEMSPYRA